MRNESIRANPSREALKAAAGIGDSAQRGRGSRAPQGACPNYIKLGQYAIGYDYGVIKAAAADWGSTSDVPVLDTEIDWMRVANSQKLAGIADASTDKEDRQK